MELMERNPIGKETNYRNKSSRERLESSMLVNRKR